MWSGGPCGCPGGGPWVESQCDHGDKTRATTRVLPHPTPPPFLRETRPCFVGQRHLFIVLTLSVIKERDLDDRNSRLRWADNT